MAIYWKVCVVVTLAIFAQVFAQRKNMPGGWADVDENEKGLQMALQIAKDEYNKANREEHITQINRFYQLRRQVVAGMKYSIDVEASLSSCIDQSYYDAECPNQKSSSKRCRFTVLIVPWRNQNELKSSYCS
ncbi:cystatin-like [Mixophyes fleayi]|uniref:cystatin-like n=1 Tax=Mixophyes fleayi TaxID=3061075 RepID=UPI003F4DBFD9